MDLTTHEPDFSDLDFNDIDFSELDKYIAKDLHALAKPTKDFTPHPNNPRGNHDIRVIANSLKEYKQRTPIVANRSIDPQTGEEVLTVLKGNGTLYATKMLDREYIAAVIVEDDPQMAMGYTIVDNQASDLSEWLDGMLLDGLEFVAGTVETGFTDLDIDEIRQRVLGDEYESDDFAEDTQLITCPDCGHQFTP